MLGRPTKMMNVLWELHCQLQWVASSTCSMALPTTVPAKPKFPTFWKDSGRRRQERTRVNSKLLPCPCPGSKWTLPDVLPFWELSVLQVFVVFPVIMGRPPNILLMRRQFQVRCIFQAHINLSKWLFISQKKHIFSVSPDLYLHPFSPRGTIHGPTIALGRNGVFLNPVLSFTQQLAPSPLLQSPKYSLPSLDPPHNDRGLPFFSPGWVKQHPNCSLSPCCLLHKTGHDICHQEETSGPQLPYHNIQNPLCNSAFPTGLIFFLSLQVLQGSLLSLGFCKCYCCLSTLFPSSAKLLSLDFNWALFCRVPSLWEMLMDLGLYFYFEMCMAPVFITVTETTMPHSCFNISSGRGPLSYCIL